MANHSNTTKPRREDPLFEVTGEIIRESEKAILFWDGTGKTDTNSKWIPHSQIKKINKTASPGQVEVIMTEWIAKEKGFI